MDRALDAVEVVCEEDKNQALWSRIQKLYAEELPVIPLYFRASSFILPKWLKGVTPTGPHYPSTLWIEKWHAAQCGDGEGRDRRSVGEGKSVSVRVDLGGSRIIT